MQPRLILASASPQRARLLADLGMRFEVHPSGFDEDAFPVSDPAERARKLSFHKAHEVAPRFPDAWVIGCDTLVVTQKNALLEKPMHADHAREMLRLQSGGPSVVHSGLTLRSPDGTVRTDLSSSHVHFRLLNEADIEWWIATGLWEGRSGAFQIDGPGQMLIRHLEGDFTSVVGLPVFLLGEMMREMGFM